MDAAAQIQCGRTTVTTHTDVVYATPTLADGSPVPLRLDVIVPDSPGPHPLVIFIPGGGFVMANKAGSLPQRTYLAEAGFTVAAIEYRTVLSEATYVEGVSDVKSAIRFLRARAGDYNIDPASVAVWGNRPAATSPPWSAPRTAIPNSRPATISTRAATSRRPSTCSGRPTCP